MRSAAPLLDKDAVAARLGIKPMLVLDLARRYALPSYRIGKYVRFAPADVDAFLEARRRTPDPLVAVAEAAPLQALPTPRRRRFSSPLP